MGTRQMLKIFQHGGEENMILYKHHVFILVLKINLVRVYCFSREFLHHKQAPDLCLNMRVYVPCRLRELQGITQIYFVKSFKSEE